MQRLKLLFYCLTRQLYICHFFGIWLFNNYSSSIALLMVTVVIGVIMFVPLFIRERSDEKLFRVRLAMNQRKPQNNN
ncbi:MAG: hypothetical protein BWX95_01767 [Bacteroidetes bacterium ADurb.Bin141]|nr:MAG: hypothetical protein BWX95_01767 [Bacteroidetes bacterium ADurb.Bin141]